MRMTSLKTLSVSIVVTGLMAGTAFAGGGENCDDKKHAAKTTAAVTSTAQTTVLSASDKATAAKMTMTFDQALAACQKKQAKDLQACIDYKTGQTAMKPQS